MASSNRLVVEVVGDTSKLTSSLNQAQQQINRFAGKSKIRSTGADALLRDVRNLEAQADSLGKRQAEVNRQSAAVTAGFGRMAAGSLVAGFAVNALGRNFQELGGEAGKFGNALSALSSGNLVGFAKAANDGKKAIADFGNQLVIQGDFAKAQAEANKLSAAGLDDLARAAQNAADHIAAVAEAQRQVIAFSSIQGTFGVSPLDPLLGKGGTTGAKRGGITSSQRNTFFDNKISRELDRVQDLVLTSQVQRLQEIKKEIQDRLAKTKDPTRRLTLGDEIVQIDRSIKSVNEEIAAGLKKTAKTLKPVGKKIAENFKQQANDIKSALLDAFDSKTDRISNARTLEDAKKTLRNVRQLGGPESIKLAQQGVFDAQRAILRQRIVDSRVSVGEGPRGPVNAVTVGNITFNITTSDPDKVAAVVLKKLQQGGRHNTAQGRGRTPGHTTGIN